MEEILKEILETLRQQKNERITFSIMEAASYSGIGHEKIRGLIEKNNTDFPFFKVGTRASINKQAFDRWLEQITTEHRVL